MGSSFGLVEPAPPAGSEQVRWVQSALNDVLNLQLPVTGMMTRETRSAIRSFQQKQGLPEDGIVGPDTEHALIEARRRPNPSTTSDAPEDEMQWLAHLELGESDFQSEVVNNQPTLRRGSRGAAVGQLQTRLKSLGFDPKGIDQIFGSNTDTAVRAFQRSRRITVDGIVGPETWKHLYAGRNNPTETTPPITPKPDATRILNVARDHIGFQESQNNGNPFSAYFGQPNVKWCAYFVSYVYTKAGFPLNIGSSDGMLNYLRTKGRFVSNTTAPEPADIVIFDWTQGDHDPAEHVGLVERVYRNPSGQIRIGTIEGNSGNGVRRRDYPIGDVRIVGFGRPRGL
jgi:peptidoglycan hydrolase-like protein with peptidoglycan-binding domain